MGEARDAGGLPTFGVQGSLTVYRSRFAGVRDRVREGTGCFEGRGSEDIYSTSYLVRIAE